MENSGFYDNLAEEYEKEDNYGQLNERKGNGTSAEYSAQKPYSPVPVVSPSSGRSA